MSESLLSVPNEVKAFENNTILVKEELPVLHNLNQLSTMAG